jgi:hypothetical protein
MGAGTGSPIPARLHSSAIRPRIGADDAAAGADHALAEDATERRFGPALGRQDRLSEMFDFDLPTELLCVSRVRK